jgi:excisionase family DNA binding protein
MSDLLTVLEVARELKVSRMTVYRRIYALELPAVDIGSGKSKLRVKRPALEAYIDARQVA